jgi:hypothetical protein
MMERASTIHLYTSTPPPTCDGRREKSTCGHRQEKRKSTRGHKREKIKSTRGHKGGQQQFLQ